MINPISNNNENQTKGNITNLGLHDHPSATTFKIDDVVPRGGAFEGLPLKHILEKYDFCSQSGNKIVCRLGPVPFLSGVYRCYAQHCPISFSPDDFWLLIIQGFSNHVNAHAEKLRHLFVNFEGKKKLSAIIDKTSRSELKIDDYKDSIDQLVNQIPKYIDQQLIDAMKPNFSTTTEDIMYVGSLSIMCSFKKYFDYESIICGCGIPSVTLEGTVEDWQNILIKIQKLYRYELDWWLDELVPIIKQIIETKKGNFDLNFWKNMIKEEVVKKETWESGMNLGVNDVKYIKGWILKFFPFNRQIKKFFRDKIEPNQLEEFAPQELKIPFLLSEALTGKSYNMIFNAGFLGMEQDPNSFKVSSVIGYYITEGKIDQFL